MFAFVISIVFHLLLVVLISQQGELKKPVLQPTITTYLALKEKKISKPDLLPKKILPKKSEKQKPKLIKIKKTVPTPKAQKRASKKIVNAPKIQKRAPKKIVKASNSPKPSKKDTPNNKDILKNLSNSFLQDIDQKQDEQIKAQESSYFDQIHSLVKNSFIVPSYLDGPSGKSLKAMVRLFLKDDGSIASINLENPSGNSNFDEAVIAGINRIATFGEPPLNLANSLLNKGVVIELCPVRCENE